MNLARPKPIGGICTRGGLRTLYVVRSGGEFAFFYYTRSNTGFR